MTPTVSSRRQILAGATAVLVAPTVLTACGGQAPAAPDAWSGLVADLAVQAFADAPEYAHLGSPAFAPPQARAKLSDRTTSGEDLRRTAVLRRAAQLRGFDLADVPQGSRRHHEALLSVLSDLAALAGKTYGRLEPDGRYRPYALDPVGAAFITLPAVFEAAPTFATLADAQAYVARLKRVRGALDGDIAKQQADVAAGFAPPLILVDRAIAVLDAFVSLPLEAWPYRASFVQKVEPLVGALSQAQPNTDAARARTLLGEIDTTIRDQILPAYQRTAQALRGLRPRADASFSFARSPDALTLWRKLVEARFGQGFDAGVARGRAEARVTALLTDLDAALRALGLADGGVGARLAQLRQTSRPEAGDPEAVRATILADLTTDANNAGAAFARGFGPAAPPALTALRGGSWRDLVGAGISYRAVDGAAGAALVVPLAEPARLSPLDVSAAALREGAPGRHVAMTLGAAASEPAFALLRLYANPASLEGWSVYALSLADDMGLAQANPPLRIAILRGQLSAASLALMELDLNSADAAYEPAIARYMEATGASRADADRLAERVLSEPGYGLSGEIGRAHIVALREQARQALGQRFDLKSFHTALLAAIPGSLAALTAAVQDWIARR